MNISTAQDRIETALISMEQIVKEPVFNEWALIAKVNPGWTLLVYGGPRKHAFLAEFNDDLAALRHTLDPSDSRIGDFAFSHEGFGSGFDAHICVGESIFVLFNNTAKSTGDITCNPKWTAAQIHFSELAESFLTDPLGMAA